MANPVSVPNSFTAGTDAVAAEVNANFTSLVDYINDNMEKIEDGKTYHLHCAGGYRSMVAASILKARGIHNMIDVQGGYGAIKETSAPKSDYVCPSTL